MKRRRHTPEQVIRKLREADRMLGEAARSLRSARRGPYARAGRRAHALRQYLECRRALADALAIEPAVETTTLQRRLLAGQHV